MAKDRTRHARRRSGDFYRARREAQLVRWVNDFARNAAALDVTMGDVLIDVERFMGAFYVHYVRDGGPR